MHLFFEILWSRWNYKTCSFNIYKVLRQRVLCNKPSSRSRLIGQNKFCAISCNCTKQFCAISCYYTKRVLCNKASRVEIQFGKPYRVSNIFSNIILGKHFLFAKKGTIWKKVHFHVQHSFHQKKLALLWSHANVIVKCQLSFVINNLVTDATVCSVYQYWMHFFTYVIWFLVWRAAMGPLLSGIATVLSKL